MAKTTINDEALQFKQRARRRLIGAICLVLLAVVLLPIFLDREPRPVSQDISVQIPSPENAPEFAPKAFTPPAPAPDKPVLAEPPPADRTPPPQPPAPAPAAAEQSVRESAAKPAPAEAQTEKREKTAEQPASAPTRNGGRFVVQLGAFSDPTNAKQLQEKLAANGIKAYTEPLRTDKGAKTRVRAGPFPSKEAAEKAQVKLKSLGLNGVIAPQ